MSSPSTPGSDRWPALRHDDWKDTLATLQLWTQIVGKIRLTQAPMLNHWWQVALYVTPRGLATSPMPYRDGRSFEIVFDFLDHVLRIQECDGRSAVFSLTPMTVADFYARVMRELEQLHFGIRINTMPNEIVDAIPFERDTTHRTYDRDAAVRAWRILLQVDRAFNVFRSGFLGKASPVHFFWGSFDLALSRFSGRTAPQHPGGFPNLPDRVTREAYSHEECSSGFWFGGNGFDASFYTYAYPEPLGYAQAQVKPAAAAWNAQLKEFVMPYEAVRSANDPDRAVLDFLASTYGAAADLAGWDRNALERPRSG